MLEAFNRSAPGGGAMPASNLFQQLAPSIVGLFDQNIPALPNDMRLVKQEINQSLANPNMGFAMQQMPQNTGSAFNSPNRVMAAAMGLAGNQGENALARSMMPLQAVHENNAATLAGFGDRESLRNGLNSMGQSQYLNQAQFNLTNKSNGQSQLLSMLMPMISTMME